MVQYDSPRLGHHIPRLYRGLNYTSFVLGNGSASMSPPNHVISPAGASLRSIVIGSAPFISFSLRSVAVSCLGAGILPKSACTVFMTGTKVTPTVSNKTFTSNLVKREVTITGLGSGTAPKMTKVGLEGQGAADWTGLESVSFDAEIDGKPAGLAIDDLDYDLKTKGCYFDVER